MSKKPSTDEKLVCRNPKATQRFDLEERLEAGIVLSGSEVKSLRAGKADLEAAFARIENGEVFVHNFYIAPYGPATAFGHDPRRTRKLLLHAHEIEKWEGRLTTKGYTLVPVRVYFKNGRAKMEIALGKGRKHGDEREKIKREVDMKEARAAMAGRRGR
jgi:SsrA-binding protein